MWGTESYGFTQWGGNPRHPDRLNRPERLNRSGEIDLSHFGRGPALKTTDDEGYNWDLKIGPDGDFMYREGWDFLGQDLAFMSAIEAYKLYGELLTDRKLKRTGKNLHDLWIKDDRLQSIDNLIVRQHPSDADTVEVKAEFTADADDDSPPPTTTSILIPE